MWSQIGGLPVKAGRIEPDGKNWKLDDMMSSRSTIMTKRGPWSLTATSMAVVFASGFAGAQDQTPPLTSTFKAANVKTGAPIDDCDRLAASPPDDRRVAGVAGVAPDDIIPGPAIKACEAAVRLYPDEARFFFQLGRGLTSARRYTEAMVSYRHAADKGYLPAMSNIGTLFQQGWGVPLDYGQAMIWYRRSADGGFAWAMKNIGWSYRYGRGVPQNQVEAMRWFKLAADGGDDESKILVANAETTEQNDAINRKASLQKYRSLGVNAEAWQSRTLGNAYQSGLDIEKDLSKAISSYRMAIKKGDAIAMYDLAKMYEDGVGVQISREKSLELYMMSADKGFRNAKERLGNAYYDGDIVRRDYAKSAKWLRAAAASHSTVAMGKLAFMSEKGIGVKRDTGLAARLYIKAIRYGDKARVDQWRSDREMLSLELRRQVQKELKALWLYTGPANGLFDEKTFAALDSVPTTR